MPQIDTSHDNLEQKFLEKFAVERGRTQARQEVPLKNVNRMVQLQECVGEAGFASWLCLCCSPKDRLYYAKLPTSKRDHLRILASKKDTRATFNLRRTGVRRAGKRDGQSFTSSALLGARFRRLFELNLEILTSFIAINFRRTSIDRTWRVCQACREMCCLYIDSAYEL